MPERKYVITSAEKARRNYFSHLAVTHLSKMRILRDGDLLRTKGNFERLGEEGIWRNVSEHCLAQAAACDALSELIGLEPKQRKRIVKAALIHDSDKKFQSLGLRAINQRIERGELTEEEAARVNYDFFEESEDHSIQNLANHGVSQEVIRIASADGHPALPRIMSPDRPLEEKILHYCGSVTSENDIVTIDERVDALESNPRYKLMNEYGREVPWTNGRTLYEVQREIGHQIEEELAKLVLKKGRLFPRRLVWMLQENPKNLPRIIKNYLLNVKIWEGFVDRPNYS